MVVVVVAVVVVVVVVAVAVVVVVVVDVVVVAVCGWLWWRLLVVGCWVVEVVGCCRCWLLSLLSFLVVVVVDDALTV